MLRLAPLPDEGGGFEAVHDRHVHVQEDEREIVAQQLAQGVLAQSALDDVEGRVVQEAFQGQQLLGQVVHQEDVHLVFRLDDAGRRRLNRRDRDISGRTV